MVKNIFIDRENLHARRPGRPFAIGDGELAGSRDRLVSLLEINWGTVGWELMRIKRTDDVLKALEPLRQEHESSYALQTLLRPLRILGTPKDLRRLRRKLVMINEAAYQAGQRKEKCRESLEQIERALAQELVDEDRAKLIEEHDKRAAALKDAESRGFVQGDRAGA